MDTLGLPLEVVLEVLKKEGFVPDWIGLFKDMVEVGQSPDRVQHKLEEAVGEVYGRRYREVFSKTLSEWRKQFE